MGCGDGILSDARQQITVHQRKLREKDGRREDDEGEDRENYHEAVLGIPTLSSALHPRLTSGARERGNEATHDGHRKAVQDACSQQTEEGEEPARQQRAVDQGSPDGSHVTESK